MCVYTYTFKGSNRIGSVHSSFQIFKDCFFVWCGSFKKSLLNLLQYCFCFIFCVFFGHEATEILAPGLGIEHKPPALEGEVLATGLPERSLFISLAFQLSLENSVLRILWLLLPSQTLMELLGPPNSGPSHCISFHVFKTHLLFELRQHLPMSCVPSPAARVCPFALCLPALGGLPSASVILPTCQSSCPIHGTSLNLLSPFRHS